jgi:hypothetical protein
LSIDGVLELRRERLLVSEARGSINAELADNLADLEETAPAFEAHENNLQQSIKFVTDILARGKTDLSWPVWRFEMPSLNRASWQTADRTGALGLMGFDTVKQYSEIYELQDLVVASQREQMSRLSGLTIVFAGGNAAHDIAQNPPEDLRIFRARALEAFNAVLIHRALVKELAGDYKAALAAR